MFALAIFGIGKSRYRIDLDLHTRPRARGMAFAVIGTLAVAIAGGILTGSAFAPRYASVIFLPLLLLVGLGVTTLFSLRVRLVVVALAVAAGLFGSFQNIDTLRTQAPQVAAVINAHAQAGDVIAFCPDQLGPAVYRVTQSPSRYRMTTFPRGTSPRFVDWVDYQKTVQSVNPTGFANQLAAEAGSGHRIWLVWEPGYQTYGGRCENTGQRPARQPPVQGDPVGDVQRLRVLRADGADGVFPGTHVRGRCHGGEAVAGRSGPLGPRKIFRTVR